MPVLRFSKREAKRGRVNDEPQESGDKMASIGYSVMLSASAYVGVYRTRHAERVTVLHYRVDPVCLK